VLDEKGQIDDAGNTEVVELGGLYDEWGWEFAAEARRRTDMIRFGRFIQPMWDKNYTDKETINLFPIPLQATKLNPELKQNPGYTK